MRESYGILSLLVVDLDTSVGVDSLRFRDGMGETVALVNTASFYNSSIDPNTIYVGSILLRGRAFVGGDPDRSSSQGH